MDSLTHNVRRANWLNIINQCQERPANVTIRQCLKDNDINEKGVFIYAEKIEYDNIEMSSRLRNTLIRNGFEKIQP